VLSITVVGMYVAVVVGLGAALQTQGHPLLSLLATGLVAVLFQPLRHHFQRRINRVMYGERDEPYAVLSRLGRRLEDAIAPLTTLPTIVETVREALKLPYVAIVVHQGENRRPVAASGIPTSDVRTLPLNHQGQPVGALHVAPRSQGEPLNGSDTRLLEDIARHAGVAVHAAQLAMDLQRSRERLVTTREEERRRLRRDLHDGLGPRLASQTLKLEAAQEFLDTDLVRAKSLLSDLVHESQELIAEVRRVVYALRPPSLDELGLMPSLREQAAQCSYGGLAVRVDSNQDFSFLPAAVEVAVFRIAQEALTNVVRHARATTCSIGVQANDDRLALEVRDDGIGIPLHARGGVGLRAMRERAEELGGQCTIEPLIPTGTRVRVELPWTKEP
jgi:signal transduction histidine kinase